MLEQLESKGYQQTSQTYRGKNSTVYELIRNKRRFMLKIINMNNTPKSIEERICAETNFLRLSESIGLNNCPSLVDYDKRRGWILQTRLKGRRMRRFDNYNIYQIGEFINRINSREALEKAEEIQFTNAREHLECIPTLIGQVHAKISTIIKPLFNDEISNKAQRWVKTELMNEFTKCSNEVLKKSDEQQWWKQNKSIYISPSDMGIHNTLKDKGNLNFFDFEYSGRDDIAKLVADLMIQPEYIMKPEQGQLLLDTLNTTESIKDTGWKKRVIDIIPVTRIKWCAIILSSLRDRGCTKMHYEKVKEYFEHSGEAIKELGC